MTRKKKRIHDVPAIAALVLDTPGLPEKLGDACAEVMLDRSLRFQPESLAGATREHMRDIVRRALAQIADGWDVDNDGVPYPTETRGPAPSGKGSGL